MQLTEEMQLAIDCATQHIREFLAQATNGEQADMGKVCGDNCQIWREGRCKSFNWLGNLDPITSQSDVKLTVGFHAHRNKKISTERRNMYEE